MEIVKSKIKAFVFGVVLFFAAMPAGAVTTEYLKLPSSLEKELPWFAARGADGRTPFTKAHLQKLSVPEGRVALVYFATWCIPCREGLKKIREAEDSLRQGKVQVVLVNVGERETEKVSKFLKRMNMVDFPIIYDNFRRLTEGFGLVKEGEELTLPKTLLLDENLKPIKYIGQEGDDYPSVLWQ